MRHRCWADHGLRSKYPVPSSASGQSLSEDRAILKYGNLHFLSSGKGREEEGSLCQNNQVEKTRLRPLSLAAVQCGPLLLKLTIGMPAPKEPTAPLVWAWVMVARAASCRCAGCGPGVAHRLPLVPVGPAARGETFRSPGWQLSQTTFLQN